MTRLEAIFSLITPSNLFVDVGTDHGQIADYAAKISKRVIASDISEKCLQKAKYNIEAKNVIFKAGDGFSVLDDDPDIISICGMGGYTILDIIKDYEGSAELILQPQNDVKSVRQFLDSNNYFITDDIVVVEKGKYYDIIKAQKSKKKNESLTSLMLLFGKFYQNKNTILKSRLLYLKSTYEAFKQTAENQQFIKNIDIALEYQ